LTGLYYTNHLYTAANPFAAPPAWTNADATVNFNWAAGNLNLANPGGFLTATGLAGLVPATAVLFNVVVPAGGIRLFALVRTASRWAERVISHEATFRLLGQLRVRLYRSLARLSPGQLGLWHGAEVLNRLTRDVDLLDNLFIRLLVPIGAATLLVGCLVLVASALSPVLVVPVGLLGLIGLVILPAVVYFTAKSLSPKTVESQERLRRHLVDLVEGLEDWSLHAPSWARQRDLVLAEDHRRLDLQMRVQRRGSAARPTTEPSGHRRVSAWFGCM